MSHEKPKPSERPKPGDEFGFTKQEQLFDRVTHERLMEFIDDSVTTVHRMEASSNSFGGDFLFVTLSKPGQDRRIVVSFWGLGFHEGRERWLTDEWFFHFSTASFINAEKVLPKSEVRQNIEDRWATIAAYPKDPQSKRGQLFEMMADLTDEDGALVEMQDLEDLGWWLLGDEDDTQLP